MLSLARKSVERESPVPEGIVRCRILPGDDSESVNTKLLALVGEAKRVLAMGCASAALRQALQAQGCEVVSVQEADDSTKASDSANLGELGLLGDADAASFDVVLAVGILEQLRDPLTVLKAAKKYLRREGFLVAAVPNVAHGNVRLALFGGRFPFGENGPFKEAPLRFFTYDSMVGLFEEAEFAIGAVERQEEDVSVPDDLADLASPDLLESVTLAPEARTAQFITVAYPLPWRGLGWLQTRLRCLAEQHTTARTEAEELRQDLEAVNSHLRMLVEQQEASLRRERDLRAQIVAVHDQLMRRDEDYRKSCADLQDRLKEAQEQLAQREQLTHQLVADRAALDARMERIRNSLPGRVFKLARWLMNMARSK